MMKNINFETLKAEHGAAKAKEIFNEAFKTAGYPGKPESYYGCRGGITVNDVKTKVDLSSETDEKKQTATKKTNGETK